MAMVMAGCILCMEMDIGSFIYHPWSSSVFVFDFCICSQGGHCISQRVKVVFVRRGRGPDLHFLATFCWVGPKIVDVGGG